MWAKVKCCLFLVALILPGQYTIARQIVVSQNGETGSLREAIRMAEPHDSLIIKEGHYPEHDVVIDKPLTIIGEGKVVIDGEGKGFVLIIRSDSVAIKNLEVHRSGRSFIEDYAGILVEKSSDVVLEQLTLTDNFFGIYLSAASDTQLTGNTITASGTRETSSGNGIHLWYSKNIAITNNRVEGHRDGFYFEFVEDVYLTGNLSKHNLRYGLHFMFSDRCAYEHNVFQSNGAGVAVMYTKNVEIKHNHFEDNWGSASYGLLLKEINNSRIENNAFINNSIAMYVEASSRNRIYRNTFSQNGSGVKLMANSTDNTFTENNFLSNTFEVTTNSRQNFNEFNKNYWSQYEGYDLDRDGLGDIPHRPVRLFALVTERHPQALILLRSLLVGIMDAAERFIPIMTPETLVDLQPKMRQIQ